MEPGKKLKGTGMSYQAVNEFLILRPIKAERVSAGGIALPDKSCDQFGDDAEVVSIGDSVTGPFQVGDIVLRPDPARVEITNPQTGEILLIVAEEDLMARVVDEEYEDSRRRVFQTTPDGETTVCG